MPWPARASCRPWLIALPGASIAVYGPQAVQRFLAGLNLSPEREAEVRRRIEQERDLDNLCARRLLDAVVSPQDLRREIAWFLGGDR